MLNLVANGPSGYNLTNSLRFRSSASAYLSRTPATTGNQKTWTWSAWVKRGALTTSGQFSLFSASSVAGNYSVGIQFGSDALVFQNYVGGGAQNWNCTSPALFRDPSAWYHIVVVADTTQASVVNGIKLYVNGVQQTFTYTYGGAGGYTQNMNMYINSNSYTHQIGLAYASYFDGYIAEQNFVDGQALTPSSFGSTNATTGVWQPAKYTGTYGTNGFYQKYSDIATTSGSNAGLGKDFSGNGNYWNTNNISVTAGTTYDAMSDVPTLTSATVANYAVLNPLWKASTGTLSSANLNYTESDSLQKYVRGTIGVTSGKWYFEGVFTNTTSAMFIGMSADTETSTSGNAYIGNSANGWSIQVTTTVNKVNNATFTSISSTNYISTSNVFQVAYDADNGKLFFGVNNTWFGSADPVAGTNAQFTSVSGTLYPSIGTQGGGAVAINFGQRPFTYTPPTGYVALNTFNLPTSTIVKGNTVMDATLYTGNLTGQSITNAASFQPDLVWIKSRSAATDNKLTDSVRGATKALVSSTTAAETTDVTGMTAFNTNGFTVGASTTYNNTGATYVGWQWQANQGSTVSNTSGTITSTVSANTTAGFSVITYTGNGTAGATIGHGLGVAPKMIIVKSRTSTVDGWSGYHVSLGATKYIELNNTNSAGTNIVVWNNTTPTSSVFSIGTGSGVNTNGVTYVAYCWAAISGYSAFGNYTGNGSTDGSFVYTGFLPRFVMIKRTDTTGDWYMWDTARNTYDVITNTLLANSSAAETSATSIDALSNGFKLRNTTAGFNASGGTYIYAAFASNPFRNSNAF